MWSTYSDWELKVSRSIPLQWTTREKHIHWQWADNHWRSTPSIGGQRALQERAHRSKQTPCPRALWWQKWSSWHGWPFQRGEHSFSTHSRQPNSQSGEVGLLPGEIQPQRGAFWGPYFPAFGLVCDGPVSPAKCAHLERLSMSSLRPQQGLSKVLRLNGQAHWDLKYIRDFKRPISPHFPPPQTTHIRTSEWL